MRINMADNRSDYKNSIWWNAPAYFDRWRVFPRLFIIIYLYLLVKVVLWFMGLPEPNMEQAGLVSVIVGAGTAWFGIYVREPAKKIENSEESSDDFIDSTPSRRSIKRRIPPQNLLDDGI